MAEDADDEVVLATGAWGVVVALAVIGHGCPAITYLDEVGAQAQAQFMVRVQRLAEIGRITNHEQFKLLKCASPPPVAEIKLSPGPGYRFFCIQDGRTWVVTHGVKKPPNKQYASEIERAQRMFATRGQ